MSLKKNGLDINDWLNETADKKATSVNNEIEQLLQN